MPFLCKSKFWGYAIPVYSLHWHKIWQPKDKQAYCQGLYICDAFLAFGGDSDDFWANDD